VGSGREMSLEEEERMKSPIALRASDEEVVVHVRGFAVLRATYEAEGYYDETADGDPEEQDLYLIEVLDARRATRAAEAVEGEAVWPLADLGLGDPMLRRLFPVAGEDSEVEELTLVEMYLLVLAVALQEEDEPVARQRLLMTSAGWSSAVIADAFQALPARWRSGSSE
jgi:hypothetical protein